MFMALPLGSAGLLSLLVGRNGCGTLFFTPSAGGSGLLMEESSAASVTCLLSVSTGDSGTLLEIFDSAVHTDDLQSSE